MARRDGIFSRIARFFGIGSESGQRRPEPAREPIIQSQRARPAASGSPVGRATVVLQNYGPVTMEFTSRNQLRQAAVYYSNASWFLRGGSRTHDIDYYVQRIESLEGIRMFGRVIEGPSEIIGIVPDDAYLETDIDSIEFWANQANFVSDANKPGS